MSRDLEQALRRFEVAASPTIKYLGIDWPEFTSFLESLQILERQAEQVLDARIGEFLSVLRRARRVLRAAPVSPSHSYLELEQVTAKSTSSVSTALQAPLQNCLEKAQALLMQNAHPSWPYIEKWIAQYSQTSNDEPIYVITNREFVPMIRAVSDENNWALQVRNVSEAKRSDTGALCLIFGSPVFLLGSQRWVEMSAAEKQVSWIFNAPLSKVVQVLSWPGNRKFDVNRYALWPDTELNTSVEGSTSFKIDVDIDSFTSEPSSRPTAIAQTMAGDGEPVPAFGIRLPDDHWVFYSDEAGPSPFRVEQDDFEIEVNVVNRVSNLSRGQVIIIRENDASRLFLDSEAQRWLTEKYGPKQFDESMRVRNEFRKKMQELHNDQFGLKRLKEAGLPESVARHRLRLAFDPTHIAPEKQTDFELLARVSGFSVVPTDFESIRRLRSALRMAGHVARKKLEQQIQEDDTWLATVETQAIARVEAPDLGSFIIAPILDIMTDPIAIPTSRLGEVQQGTTSK